MSVKKSYLLDMDGVLVRGHTPGKSKMCNPDTQDVAIRLTTDCFLKERL